MPSLAITQLYSLSPYGQSKYYDAPPKEKKENPANYEERTWRERCHYDEEGRVFIPPMCFKNSLTTAASFLSEKIPGKGNQSYSKHFRAGIIVPEGIMLPQTKDTVLQYTCMCSANGIPGGARRVKKHFPYVTSWKGTIEFHVLDDMITEEVFTRTLREAGSMIGIGYFRPEKGGYWGRFGIEKIEWKHQGY